MMSFSARSVKNRLHSRERGFPKISSEKNLFVGSEAME